MILYRISILEKGGTFHYGTIHKKTFQKTIREATYSTNQKTYHMLVELYSSGEGSVIKIYDEPNSKHNQKELEAYYVHLYKLHDDIVSTDIRRRALKVSCLIVMLFAFGGVLYQAIRPFGSPILAICLVFIAIIANFLRRKVDKLRE